MCTHSQARHSTPPVAVKGNSALCKSNSLLLFSLVVVFSSLPAHSLLLFSRTAFQTFHIIPPLPHLACRPAVKCICSTPPPVRSAVIYISGAFFFSRCAQADSVHISRLVFVSLVAFSIQFIPVKKTFFLNAALFH